MIRPLTERDVLEITEDDATEAALACWREALNSTGKLRMALAGAAQKIAMRRVEPLASETELKLVSEVPPGFLSLAGTVTAVSAPGCESLRTGFQAAPGYRPRRSGGAELDLGLE